MTDDFNKLMSGLSTTELLKIINAEEGDYKEEARDAAGKEIEKRNLSKEQLATLMQEVGYKGEDYSQKADKIFKETQKDFRSIVNALIALPDNKKRPLSIMILCIFFLLGVLLISPFIFLGYTEEFGEWYPFYLIAINTVRVIFVVGVWKMKKWASLGLLSIIILDNVVSFLALPWNNLFLLSYCFSLMYILILLVNLKEMD